MLGFNPLSTNAISAAGSADTLNAAIDVSATATLNLVQFQPIAAAIDVSATATLNLVQLQPIAASQIASATVESTLTFENSLTSLVNATAEISGAALTLEHSLTSLVNVTAEISGAALTLEQLLTSSITATAEISGAALTLENPLTSLVNVTAEISGDIITALNCSINATAEISGDIITALNCSITSSAEATLNLVQFQPISANIGVTVSANLESYKLILSNVFCTAETIALLDVDGNTEGSPGGFPAPGFTPLSSVVLAQHIESEPTATYTITADFDPLLETEITSVFFNDNPVNVLSYSIIGPDLFITANTPAAVYAQASTFMVNRKVVPQFNESINYNVRFNTTVKRDNNGGNFYSDKFYAEQNSICFLQDDGTGMIDLYEEITPGTTKKLKTIGRIDYTTGFVEVRNLMITSLYDLELFFFVESLYSIIPTKDYFTEQNNLLVQSKTITFPTGEQVEISQYEKQTDMVDIEIYVTARSYALASPLTTVETRTATYVLRIYPDYNIGKTAIKQLLLEQEA